MNTIKRNLLNLGLKYRKPKKYDRKIQHIIKDYDLPDPLIFSNGENVLTKQQWVEMRRGEILRLFEENIYGKLPTESVEATYKILNEVKDDFDGLATKKAVVLGKKRSN
jgi:(4-O-methyl)-D-glucuronate---lignin esterase